MANSKRSSISLSLEQRLGSVSVKDWVSLLFIVDLLHFCYLGKYPSWWNRWIFLFNSSKDWKKERLNIAAAECRVVHSCMNTRGSCCMWNAYKWKNVNKRKQLQDKSLTLPTYPSGVLTERFGLDCLVSHYVNYQEAHNHTPTVPQSVAMSHKYVDFSSCFLFILADMILQRPYTNQKVRLPLDSIKCYKLAIKLWQYMASYISLHTALIFFVYVCFLIGYRGEISSPSPRFCSRNWHVLLNESGNWHLFVSVIFCSSLWNLFEHVTA